MEEELKMLELLEHGNPLDRLEQVVSAEELLAAQQAVRNIHVDPKVRRYITQIVQNTRNCDDVSLGGSPRASLALFRTVAGVGRGFGAELRAARRRETDDRPCADPSPDPAAGEPPAEAHRRGRRGRGRGRGRRCRCWPTKRQPGRLFESRSLPMHEMVRRGYPVVVGVALGLRAELAGLCDVRPAGDHAGEPLAGAALDRRTFPP